MATAAAAAAVLLLSGCSSSQPETDDDTSPSPTKVSTSRHGTTSPGSELDIGETAVVRYRADRRHSSRISLTVTKVREGEIKDLTRFNLDTPARRSTVYYVSARVRSTGTGDLSRQPITLYGKVSDDLVVPPVEFGTTFGRCDHEPLPEKFGNGDRARVCMVMLAPRHGKILEVHWRPGKPEPIAWKVR